MKKILSTVLALTMILSLVAAMGLSVSAKDGDVLYKVNFKGDDKYAPGTFSCLVENCLDYVVSDDGTSATVTYKSDVSKGRAFWGGTVQGLTYGEGKQYTIAMKMAIGTYINDSGVLSSGNAGVFINMPVNTDPTYLLDLGYKSLVGYYGCPNIRHIMSYGAGGKATGKMISSNVGYFTTNLSTVDAEGFVDIAFVVDGKNVKVFINNVYIDEFDAFNAGMVTAAGNVGISAYLYNPGASITMKDVVIYEGNTVTNPTYPDYYVEGAAVTTYDSTKTGDLLFSADFSRNDGGFNPRFLAGNGGKIAVTTDPANKNYIKFEQDGTKAAGTYYGAVVEGLEVNSETRYTTEWKVKTGAQNSGFCFAVPTLFPFSYSYNIYGNFQTGSFATEYGSTKITNINTPGEEYVPILLTMLTVMQHSALRCTVTPLPSTISTPRASGSLITLSI